jgi:hypothetical protein
MRGDRHLVGRGKERRSNSERTSAAMAAFSSGTPADESVGCALFNSLALSRHLNGIVSQLILRDDRFSCFVSLLDPLATGLIEELRRRYQA